MGNSLTGRNTHAEKAINKRKREDDPESSKSIDVLNTPICTQMKRIKSTSKYIYQTLFLEGEQTDVTIIALNKNWKLHKHYLKQFCRQIDRITDYRMTDGKCQYFAGMFSGSWKESDMQTIEIDIIDENITEECLKIAFGSLYKDDIFMKPVQVIGVLAAATLLQLDGLIQQCSLMMSETLSAETVTTYHYASICYGLEDVKNKCLTWMLQNLLVTQRITFIKDVSLDLMEKIVSSAELFVLQVEIDVYSVLKKYIFLKLNPGWSEDVKDLQKDCDLFFKSRFKESCRCYLESEEGRPYRTLFTRVRWIHVINDLASIKLIESDQIIPINSWIITKACVTLLKKLFFLVLTINKIPCISQLGYKKIIYTAYSGWLDSVFLHGWRRLLSVEQGMDRGPETLDERVFSESCTRCGRILTKPADYCWRWVGFNYGLDILISFSNRLITLKRNTHTQLCPHAVSLLNQRNLSYRLMVSHLDDNGKETMTQSTGIKRISLGKDEEEIVMVLETRLQYPIIICMNMMLLSPFQDLPAPRLNIPD